MKKRLLMKNSKGFVSLASLNLIVIFISLYFTLCFSVQLIAIKNYVRKTCLLESVRSQKKILRIEKKLVQLNPLSTALRSQIKITQFALAIATVNSQAALIVLLQKKLVELYAQQKKLDLLQKSIIYQIQLLLAYEPQSIIQKVKQSVDTDSSGWADITQTQSHFSKNNLSEIAFMPDSEGGLGPNYVLKKNAERLQSLSFIWQYSFRTLERFQAYVFWNNHLKMICAATPQFGGHLWSVKISQGKL